MKKIVIKIFLLFVCTFTIPNSEASELTILSGSTFTPTHTNRFSILAGLNPSYSKSGDMTNFTFSYGKKMEDYWIDTNFSINNGLFKKFSANNKTATGATDTQLERQQNSLTTIGFGVGRESHYAQTLLPFDNIYELMAADLTYNSYSEGFSGKTFSGPGLLTKFSLYKKVNDYFSAGAHFIYNLAVVKRAQDDAKESNSQRSLTLGFLTTGIDLSFFF